MAQGFNSFQLGHYSQVRLFNTQGKGQNLKKCSLYGDYTFNVLNSASLKAIGQMNIMGSQFSFETDQDTFSSAIEMNRHFGTNPNEKKERVEVGLLVYGRPSLFTARLKAKHLAPHQNITSPKNEKFLLLQKDGITHARSTLPFSLLQWRDDLEAIGPDYFVIDLSGSPLRKEVATFLTLLQKTDKRVPILSGNFKKNLL